jgi:hypothetical protein
MNKRTMIVNMPDGGKITLLSSSQDIKVIIEKASLHSDKAKQEYMDVIAWASNYINSTPIIKEAAQ